MGCKETWQYQRRPGTDIMLHAKVESGSISRHPTSLPKSTYLRIDDVLTYHRNKVRSIELTGKNPKHQREPSSPLHRRGDRTPRSILASLSAPLACATTIGFWFPNSSSNSYFWGSQPMTLRKLCRRVQEGRGIR